MNLSNPAQIWTLTPTKDDLNTAAQYALVSLPWTFNRMMANTSFRGQNDRALNISKGIVAQELLRRRLKETGINCQVDRTSYRETDFFDVRVQLSGKWRDIDLKSWAYYNDYEPLGREPLTPGLVIKNADYAGPKWARFFPMLVPADQLAQGKELYCFAVADTFDLRKDIDKDRSGHIVAAFPNGEHLPFLSSRRLCEAREEAGKGVYVGLRLKGKGLFNGHKLRVDLYGEFGGKQSVKNITVDASKVAEAGPFSCLSSIALDYDDYKHWESAIELHLTVTRSDFQSAVRNSAMKNINVAPKVPLVFARDHFCNLVLPTSYKLHVLGWITKEQFLKDCRTLPAWVWPTTNVRSENTAWTQITEHDTKKLTRTGFEDCIEKKPSRVAAGWMKTTGQGGGACCYYYPNIGKYGGVKDTNTYVLPKHLYTMDSMKDGSSGETTK